MIVSTYSFLPSTKKQKKQSVHQLENRELSHKYFINSGFSSQKKYQSSYRRNYLLCIRMTWKCFVCSNSVFRGVRELCDVIMIISISYTTKSRRQISNFSNQSNLGPIPLISSNCKVVSESWRISKSLCESTYICLPSLKLFC